MHAMWRGRRNDGICVAENDFYLKRPWDLPNNSTSATALHDVIDLKVCQQSLLVMPIAVIKPQVV